MAGGKEKGRLLKTSVEVALEATAALAEQAGVVCAGADARRADGSPCGPCDPEACSWCVTGAWLRIAYDYDGGVFIRGIDLLSGAIGARGEYADRVHALQRWGDRPGRRVEHVVSLFRRAGEAASG